MVEIGSDMQNAILIEAPDSFVGVSMEYEHIKSARCIACGGRFDVVSQQLMQHENRKYDRLDLKCNNCGLSKNLFFDITDFFGKY
ncbi:MAG: hypothetical protein ABIH42_02290 [Planctomycetota bacterium]